MAFVSNLSGEKASFNLFEVIFHNNFLLLGSDDDSLLEVLEFHHKVA